MGLVDTLARGRAAAQARMTSRVTIHRPTGRATQDEASGRQVRVTTPVATDVPFRLDGPGDGASKVVSVNGVEYQQATGTGHLPAGFDDLRDNDVIEVTSGEWAGSRLRVISAVKADQKTARRVPVVEA